MTGALRRRVIGLPRRPRELDRTLLLLGELRAIGWTRSAGERRSVDAHGGDLPWMTYPAIAWLDAVLPAAPLVFEWGSGASTRWFLTRGATVDTVEHDPSWADRLVRAGDARLRVHVHSVDDPAYVRAIELRGDAYDVVVVDGRRREDCLAAASRHVANDGLIVLDNSDRARYHTGIDALAEDGFGRIDFSGFAPGTVRLGTTSVFARDLTRWSRPPSPPRPDPSSLGTPPTA